MICSCFVFNSHGQTGIDYLPKALIKELSKVMAVDRNALNELPVPEKILINGKYFRIVSAGANPYEFIYVGRVNSCRSGGCSAILAKEKIDGVSEYFDYFILFDQRKSVKTVKVFNYQATHGQEISSSGWLQQFSGYNGLTALQVGKNIDAISGATISVDRITSDIEEKTRILNKIMH